MPIYEYKCKKCGNVFEYLAKNFNDVALQCPNCSSKKIEKLMSSFTATESKKSSCKENRDCEHRHSKGHCCGSSCCCHQ